MRFRIAIASLVLSTISWAESGTSAPLTGGEIQILFSGATMRGVFVEDASAWSERTTKSGRVLDMLKGGKDVGAWSVAGDQICYIYFGTPPSRPCYTISKRDDAIVFSDPKTGDPFAMAKIVPPSRH